MKKHRTNMKIKQMTKRIAMRVKKLKKRFMS